MAQEQPKRSGTEQDQQQPIKYGDVFLVSEKIADKPIAPLDAAAMQSAENQVLGHTQKGGPAAVMQSAATKNVQAGALPRGSATDVGRNQGMTVTESIVDGQRVITESVGDQVVARYANPDPNPIPEKMVAPPSALDRDAVTIGEALEATVISAGDKPITQTDAAAIQAAEMRATGRTDTPPGGLGAEAQSAATRNERIMRDENKTTLGEILADATTKLGDDKPATIQDAEKVIAAEMRNDPKMATNLGGVGESVAAAARLNQQKLKE
ncbi:late embryogenesis abundant protein D-34 [Beta vulgaris subsp. vulgaris]|uniref:late embryogenesis abundant protein D-34 n=1 Tax=Beta vulgaris subsp. vulgaris TaxID=3555 RepID=UPI002036F67C|nr:late embryogenesis abundant protein D-34 [Beta vulgaris subsp. vulgaris]